VSQFDIIELPGHPIYIKFRTIPKDSPEAARLMETALNGYQIMMDTAQQNFEQKINSGRGFETELAADEKIVDELDAEIRFWDKLDFATKVGGVGVVTYYTTRLMNSIQGLSVTVQGRVAAAIAMIATAGTELTAREIVNQKEGLTKRLNEQKEYIERRKAWIDWELNQQGMMQPPPEWPLANCVYKETCGAKKAKVCVTDAGGVESCDEYSICSTEVISC